MGDLFDSPWKIALIVALIIVLFGAKKLPGAAKSLGQSMRIFKNEIGKMHDDDDQPGPVPAKELTTQQPAAVAAADSRSEAGGRSEADSRAEADAQQERIDALEQTVRDLQRQAAKDPVASSTDK